MVHLFIGGIGFAELILLALVLVPIGFLLSRIGNSSNNGKRD